ncbi:hypothetical protein A2U01_0065219, partial [Trifolium medium]|nr:hypothetical protein [Trifolium medium]
MMITSKNYCYLQQLFVKTLEYSVKNREGASSSVVTRNGCSRIWKCWDVLVFVYDGLVQLTTASIKESCFHNAK